MTTVNCPHQRPAIRSCTGCIAHPSSAVTSMLNHCHGEIDGTVYRDSDGDAGVINGVRHILTVEDETATCGCQLTEDEWETAREELVLKFDEADFLESMAEDQARREAGF